MPFAPGAAGAPDAVHVAVAVGGRVEVDDVRDALDVDAARGDVGRDERVDRARLEPGERLLALALGLVAVHRDGGDAGVAEALDEAVRAALRADEHERAVALAAQLADEGVHAAVALDRDEAVLDLGGPRLARRVVVARARRGCTATRAGRPHRRGLRRRTASGDRRGQAATIRSTAGRKPMSSMRSASSRTRISMCVEREGAAREEVLEAAGGRDEDVGAAGRAGLLLEADAAVDGRDVQAAGRGDGVRLVDDLRGELAGRGEDERARAAGRRLRASRRSAPRTPASCRTRWATWRARRARPGRRRSRGAGWRRALRCRARRARRDTASDTPRSAKDCWDKGMLLAAQWAADGSGGDG